MSADHDSDSTGGDAVTAEDVVEQEPLIQVFGDHPKARILFALATNHNPINPSRIAEVANIDPSTWHRHKDDLLDAGIIVKTGNIGNSPVYQLTNDERREALTIIRDITGAELRD